MPHPLLEFERVLHVPNLRSNLLSVLYLTRNKDYRVSIVGSKMFFNRYGTLLFTATVTQNNTALLDGITEPMTRFAGLISTCPLDIHCGTEVSHLNFRDMLLGDKRTCCGITMKSMHLQIPL